MKKIFYTSILCCVLSSCTNKEEQLKSVITKELKPRLEKDGIIFKADSILIDKIDTLTVLKDSLIKSRVYDSEYEKLKNRAESLNELSDAQHNLYKSQMSLVYTYIYGGHKEKSEQAMKDAQETSNKANSTKRTSLSYSERSLYYLKMAADIVQQRESGKLDSMTNKGFIAYFSVKGRDKQDKVTKIDSLIYKFSPEGKILNGYNLK